MTSRTAGLGVGASDSINFRRVHFAFALMNSTMRLMFSETGVVSRSRNCGRATLTCVTVLLTLKKLQAVMRELLAQLRGDRQREKFLLLPFLSDEPLQAAATQTAARQPGNGERLDRLDDGILVRLAEMFFHFFERWQRERLRHVEADVLRLEALLLDPFLHDRFFLHDSHARLEHVERHPRKLFCVQLAQLVLVIVIIRRAENDTAHAALRDERINALGRFRRGAFSLVKRGEMIFEDVRDSIFFARPR